jgi:hypothetical protein
VQLTASDNRPEFLPIDRDMLVSQNGSLYLPVWVLHVDRDRRVALVSLPVEADSGAHRIWVKLDHMQNLAEMPA